MSVGASFLSLLGRDDPRKALLQAVAGASQPAEGGAQYAEPVAGGGGATATADPAAAGAQPAAAPEIAAYKSPPDLSALYGDLLKYSSQENNLNRGFGLIGSSISQDANRADTLKAFTGENSGAQGIPGLDGMANTMLEMNKAALAKQQRAATLASLPMIAKRYGLTMEAAKYLLDTGKLDTVIAEEEKPNNEFRTDAATGENLLIDKTGNKVLGTFGGTTPKEYSITDLADGTKAPFDKTTGTIGDPMGPTKPAELKSLTLADGTIVSYDPTKGTIGDPMGPKKAEERSADQKNYDAYTTDEVRRGRIPMSYNDWDLQAKNAAASKTTVNNLPATPIDKEKDEFAKKRGEKLGEKYVNIQNAADSALQTLELYDAVEAGLNTDVRTGAFAETEQSLRKFGQALGLDTDPEKIAGGELVTAIQNRMALQMRNPESGMGMPGSLSDKDIEFLKAAQIGMGTTKEGNKTLMEVYRRIEKRKIEMADLADTYADKFGSLRGFNKAASDYNSKNPMFQDLQIGSAGPDDVKVNSLLDKYAPRKK